jgi:hypothetical protein
MYKSTNNVIDTVVLKCESQKTFDTLKVKSNIWELMPSIMSTYSYKEDRYRIWTYNKKSDLLKYLSGKNIVCFNGVRFDIPLITGCKFTDVHYLLSIDGCDQRSVVSDIFMHVMHVIYKSNSFGDVSLKMNKKPIMNMQSYSLYNIYCNTLNKNINKKLYDINCSQLFQNKKILELVEVNLYKLRIVKQLYEFILKNRYVVNGDFDIVKIDDLVSPRDVDETMFMAF